MERLKKGIGFAPNAFREGFVFHGVLTCRLKFNPQALNAGQMLVGAVYGWGGIHAPRVSGKNTKSKIGLSTTRSTSPSINSTHNHQIRKDLQCEQEISLRK